MTTKELEAINRSRISRDSTGRIKECGTLTELIIAALRLEFGTELEEASQFAMLRKMTTKARWEPMCNALKSAKFQKNLRGYYISKDKITKDTDSGIIGHQIITPVTDTQEILDGYRNAIETIAGKSPFAEEFWKAMCVIPDLNTLDFIPEWESTINSISFAYSSFQNLVTALGFQYIDNSAFLSKGLHIGRTLHGDIALRRKQEDYNYTYVLSEEDFVANYENGYIESKTWVEFCRASGIHCIRTISSKSGVEEAISRNTLAHTRELRSMYNL